MGVATMRASYVSQHSRSTPREQGNLMVGMEMTKGYGGMQKAKKAAHVPKFGNWDGDNIPYTTYFENAQKPKSPAGQKNFNPNDPEQNPDAFVSGIFPAEYEQKNKDSGIYGMATGQQNKYGIRTDVEYQGGNMELPARSKNRKNAKSVSGSGKNSSDHSVPYPTHRRPSRYSDEDGVSIPPAQQSGLRQGRSPRLDAMHDRPSSVPKFGVWDEMDPNSGDGFTVIFNKVKQEKQAAATKLPKVPNYATIYPSQHKNHVKSSSRSKIACCFWSAVSE